MKLSYWNCRGLGHPIKLLLEYCEEEYEYETVMCGEAPYFNKKDWYENKYKLLEKFDFPNLPYLEDKDVCLTHHVAIMQYLGRKYGLSPITDIEHRTIDMVREQIVDLSGGLLNVMYFPGHRTKGTQPTLVELAQKKQSNAPIIKFNITDIGRMYIKQKSQDDKAIWIAGRRLTYVDFMLYEQLDYARHLFPEIFVADELCSSLNGFMKNFEELPTIKSYLSSEKFQKFPFYGERSYMGRSLKECYQEIQCSFERKSFF